jgi:hypothetical protein
VDDDLLIVVSPRHSLRLAREYQTIVEKAPTRDFVVRTITRREANGLPLMSAEIVIAGEETRRTFPLAEKYPLHFRKTYFPGRLHGDPEQEFLRQSDAHRLIGVPPPIGFGSQFFRACLVPGTPYGALSPFRGDLPESDLRHARALALDAAAGQYKLAEQALEQLQALHRGGMVHGDAELGNFVVCPSPLEIVPIDFESSSLREGASDEEWQARIDKDLDPLLRHAVLLECALGAQPGTLAELALARIDRLFREPDRFRREIERRSDLDA